MPEDIKTVKKEVRSLRKEVEEIKSRLDEDFELSDWAKERIENYKEDHKEIPHKKIKEKFS